MMYARTGCRYAMQYRTKVVAVAQENRSPCCGRLERGTHHVRKVGNLWWPSFDGEPMWCHAMRCIPTPRTWACEGVVEKWAASFPRKDCSRCVYEWHLPSLPCCVQISPKHKGPPPGPRSTKSRPKPKFCSKPSPVYQTKNESIENVIPQTDG